MREITSMPTIRERSVVRSSVIASVKYCCSRSLLRLVNGRTTIDRRGAVTGDEVEVADDAFCLGEPAVASGCSA